MVLRRAGVIERTPLYRVEIPAAATRHEIPNPLLRRDPLVQMIVSAEDDVHAVAQQRGLERGPDAVAALARVFP